MYRHEITNQNERKFTKGRFYYRDFWFHGISTSWAYFCPCWIARDIRLSDVWKVCRITPLIVIIITAYPPSSHTDHQVEIKIRFRDKSAIICNVSSGVHPCNNERIKKCRYCVQELLYRISEPTNARIKYPDGVMMKKIKPPPPLERILEHDKSSQVKSSQVKSSQVKSSQVGAGYDYP